MTALSWRPAHGNESLASRVRRRGLGPLVPRAPVPRAHRMWATCIGQRTAPPAAADRRSGPPTGGQDLSERLRPPKTQGGGDGLPAGMPVAVRIALVTPRFSPHLGGVEAHVGALAPRIAAAGHDVEVITPDVAVRRPTVERVSPHLSVRRFPAYGWETPYTQAPELWWYLRRSSASYGLVHAHSYHATPALASALAPGPPLVFTPHYNGAGHTPATTIAHFLYRPMGRIIIRRAAAIICVSRAESDLLVSHFPRAAGRATIIPNGVEPSEVEAEPYPSTGRVVLCVGRLEPYKNVDLVVRAMRHLPAEFRLVVVGSGRSLADLQSLASTIDTPDRIRLLGSVSQTELARWRRTAAAYVSMSTHEAFGITVVDALLARVPVIASDIPAHRELADRAATGAITFVAPDATPQHLASAIAAASLTTSAGLKFVPTWFPA